MDMINILVVTVFAIYVRYDFSFKDLPDYFLKSTIWFIPINLVVTMISFAFGCYIRHQVFLSCASNSPCEEKNPRGRQRAYTLHGYRRRQCGK